VRCGNSKTGKKPADSIDFERNGGGWAVAPQGNSTPSPGPQGARHDPTL
jgi:hypothetical protein